MITAVSTAMSAAKATAPFALRDIFSVDGAPAQLGTISIDERGVRDFDLHKLEWIGDAQEWTATTYQTNAEGKGLWMLVGSGGAHKWKQILGRCQFSLRCSPYAARVRVRWHFEDLTDPHRS